MNNVFFCALCTMAGVCVCVCHLLYAETLRCRPKMFIAQQPAARNHRNEYLQHKKKENIICTHKIQHNNLPLLCVRVNASLSADIEQMEMEGKNKTELTVNRIN